MTEVKKPEPKDESNYATENAESPLRKVLGPKEKGFTKLKKRAMNHDANIQFCIKPMEIKAYNFNTTTKKHQESCHDVDSLQNSPLKLTDSPGISPTCTPKIPKFCRKNTSSSSNNLKLKLRVI